VTLSPALSSEGMVPQTASATLGLFKEFLLPFDNVSAYAGSCPFIRTGKNRKNRGKRTFGQKRTFEAVFDTIKGPNDIVC
jgi:hypothetical protein